MPPRALIYSQHLLGVGHVFRTKHIAEAMVADGFEVTVALGGMPIAGLTFDGCRLEQLEPLRSADGGFSTLLGANGDPVDDAMKERRRLALIRLHDAIAPDVVITEAFPLARRAMRFELVPLIERARSRDDGVLIACSSRDILQRSRRPERVAESIATFERWYDLLLVHGDERFTRLEDSLPEAAALADSTVYTGIVAPPQRSALRAPGPAFDVVVSAGGGAVGYAVLAAAIAAKPLTAFDHGRWLALTGPNLPAPQFDDLSAAATAAGITIERFRPGLVDVLRQTRVSVQQAGYNTVADVLIAQCRAVLVPFDSGGETEQTVRADLLAKAGRAVVVREAGLTPESMARAIDAAAGSAVPAFAVDVDGARRTATIVRQRYEAKKTS